MHAEAGGSGKLRELALEVLPGDNEMRLDLFLCDRMPWRSRNSIKKLIAEEMVSFKNRDASRKPSTRVKSGDRIGVTIPIPRPHPVDAFTDFGDLDLDIIHEDRWILAVNKPSGVPVHPAGRLLERTVITALRERYAPEHGLMPEEIKLCHRLDHETSGVLLVSRDPITMPSFSAQFEFRKASKEYLAIVHGAIKKERGEIDLPIGVARNSKIQMKRGIRPGAGQPARTSFVVEQRFKNFTLVRLRLHTGRHHQIRVHLSAIGYPIVGDKLYGLDERFFLTYLDQGRLDDEAMKRILLPRQALHACSLRVHHVGLKKDMTFEAPLPDDLVNFLNVCDGE